MREEVRLAERKGITEKQRDCPGEKTGRERGSETGGWRGIQGQEVNERNRMTAGQAQTDKQT